MTTFWCEHAVLPGGVRRLGSRRRRPRPHPRGPLRGAGQPDDTRLSGVVLPGLANGHSHAFHRALRGRTHDDGGNFWSWRDAMYAVTHRLDPDSYHALAKAVFAEMVLAGYTVGGGVPLRAPRRGRPPLRRPEPDGEGAGQRGAGGRHPDHAARHLLPRRRADGRRPPAARRGAATVLRRHGGRGPSGSPPVGRRHGADRCGRALGARGAPRRPRRRRRGSVERRPPAARAPLGAAGREPGLRGLLRVLAHALLADEGAARAADDRGARHPPVRRRHRGAGTAPRHRLLLPHHRARPRRRHRAGASAARRRQPTLAGLRPARRHRPVRGGTRRRDARTARDPRARPVRAGRPAGHGGATTATGHWAGTTAA